MRAYFATLTHHEMPFEFLERRYFQKLNAVVDWLNTLDPSEIVFSDIDFPVSSITRVRATVIFLGNSQRYMGAYLQRLLDLTKPDEE